MNFSSEARRLMAEQGLSLRELARRAHLDPGTLSKVLNGHRQVSPHIAAAVGGALGAREALMQAEGVHLFDGSLSPDRRQRLEHAARYPQRPDPATADTLAAVLDAQRRAEDTLGSVAVMRPVLAQLAVVENMVREARGPHRAAIVHQAAQWAQFAGWLHANTGQPDEADRRLSQALQWALEAGDVDLISEVLSFQGHAAYLAGYPGPVIGLSRAARRDPGAYPGQLAISAAQEAKGHAMEGRGREADRLLDEADELADDARGRRDEAPPWLYYHTDGFFDLQRGEAYGYLAADPHYRAHSAAALETGYEALPPSAQGSEWTADYLVRLAAVHARGGEAEQACAAAFRAAAIARQTGSARLYRMLRRSRSALSARWPDAPCVAALADALR